MRRFRVKDFRGPLPLIPVVWLTLLFWMAPLLTSPSAEAARRSKSPEAQFLKVREKVTRFRKDTKKRKYRHNYEQLITQMRAVSAKYPRSSKADDALLVAAQLYEELYEVSRVGKDLTNAYLAYEEVANRYPRSTLADDALFRSAKLRLERQGDHRGAKRLLERIVAMKGRVDHRPLASELLGRLPASQSTRAQSKQARKETKEEAARDRQARLSSILANVASGSHGQHNHAETGISVAQTHDKAQNISEVVFPEAPNAGAPLRKIVSLRHIESKSRSVVRIRLNKSVGIEKGEIAKSAKAPHRLFFDLSPVWLGKNDKRELKVDNKLVSRVRLGQYDKDTVRMVVELKGEPKPRIEFGTSPFELRLVASDSLLDIASRPGSPRGSEVNTSEVAPNNKSHGSRPESAGIDLKQTGIPIRTIVVDAGHGGHDSGAIGKSGVREKDVNLLIAKLVTMRLKKSFPKMKIIMTRTDDQFIELARRTEIANEAGADLFISVHANANPSKHVRGVETYYLNISHDRYASRLAARENSAAGETSISDLDFILADLSMKSNVDDSIRLGRHVQNSLVSTLRKDWDKVNDLGLKHALFYVLLGTRMPSILVEASFLSNPTEEKRLASKEYQEAVANGIVTGVHRYLEERQAYFSK
jgi:N-acetylmuramoyl-L-alanine amidase